ncbi:MAG TPA: cobalamin-dependent protein [Oscillospiraceae bacterium]|nr:cobalamin-dependent protein [Oscillospiraceae bacterium]
MMKVLLVRPILLNLLTISSSMDCEPLELEYLFTACKEINVDAMIYDGIVEHRKFSDVLKKYRPDIVAMTGYITQENSMKKYAGISKRICPSCKVIIGGVHAQLNYKRLYFPDVDYLFRSESMQSFQELIVAIENHASVSTINGLCYRSAGEFVENELIPCDINDLPIPIRDFQRQHADQFRYLEYSAVATLKTAVSCPYKCSFCYGTNLHGGSYQARSIEKVIDEIKLIDAQTIFIVDSDFLVNENRLHQFAAAIKSNNIHKAFICYARADFIVNHSAVVHELCEVGFAYFLVGIEGIEDSNLKSYDKLTSKEINESCIRILNQNNAECIALLIADLSFRRKDFKHVYAWIKQQKLNHVSMTVFTPIPPTTLYQKEKEKIFEKNIEKWDLAHLVIRPQNISAFRFYRNYHLFILKAFLLGYKRGAYRFVNAKYILHLIASYLKRRNTIK